jgi:hypothetical protein
VHAKDALEWNLLLSDPIHPNMAGHKLFAEPSRRRSPARKLAQQTSARHCPQCATRFEKLKTGQPVKVLAMPPYDTLIAPAIQQLYPKAVINVTHGPSKARHSAQLEESAKKVRSMAQDLVLIAVPGGHFRCKSPRHFHQKLLVDHELVRSASARSSGTSSLHCHPRSKTDSPLKNRQHEDFARSLIEAQDLHMLAGDAFRIDHHCSPNNSNPKTDSQ